MRSKTNSGVKVFCTNEHRNKEGELISSGRTRGKWWLYFFGNWDKWRTNYCEQHRNDRLPQSFRKGEITLSSILVTIKFKKQEV